MKPFLANFYRHLAIFFWSHWYQPCSYLSQNNWMPSIVRTHLTPRHSNYFCNQKVSQRLQKIFPWKWGWHQVVATRALRLGRRVFASIFTFANVTCNLPKLAALFVFNGPFPSSIHSFLSFQQLKMYFLLKTLWLDPQVSETTLCDVTYNHSRSFFYCLLMQRL